MATTTIAWGDGTADKITVTYAGTVGSSQMTIASNVNQSLNQRKKTINLTINGQTKATVTVTQPARSRSYSVAYNNGYK
jgi:hypothetical protein|nr:MAG TPA: hypothetical protein [Caudoviricetes sp.]